MKATTLSVFFQILFWLFVPVITTFLWWLFQFTTLAGMRGSHSYREIWQDGFELNLTLVLIGAASFYYTRHIRCFPKARRSISISFYGLLLVLIPPAILLLYSSFSMTVTLMFRYFLYFGYFVQVVFVIVALAMRYLDNWIRTTRTLAGADKNAAELELQMLKSHLSPHFLFNTINNIDALITRDPRQASDYLNKLAELFRFILYQTSAATLRLADELLYIRRYMDLQRIRSVNPDYCRLDVEGEPGKWEVIPLLFLPLVENAFKHCTSKSASNSIMVRFQIEDDKLIFHCQNIYVPNGRKEPEGGIGELLIKRRLELAYPSQYSLISTQTDGSYFVTLTIYA